MDNQGLGRLSIFSQGSRHQLKLAILLLAVIPILVCAFLAITLRWGGATYSVPQQFVIGGFALALAYMGYTMLRKYPRNLERLRAYLKDIAGGNLPEHVELLDREDDLNAIETYLNAVLGDLRGRVQTLEEQLDLSRRMQRTIEAQGRELIEAERHRVMVESLGAACHHIGQPATVLQICLESIRNDVQTERVRQNVDRCMDAVTSIGAILSRLRQVSEYRTVPYQTFLDDSPSAVPSSRILDIPTAASAQALPGSSGASG